MSAVMRTAGALIVRAVLAAVLAVALAALVAGCGDDDPSPAPAPSSDSAGTSPTDEPTDEPTDTSTSPPGATPAAGLLVEEETSQLHAPEGAWSRIPDTVTYSSAVGRDGSSEVIALSDRESFSSPASLTEQADYHVQSLPSGAVVEQMPDVVLDGEPAYYVRWHAQGDPVVQHDLGLDRAGRTISVTFDLEGGDPAATEALIASVVASFTWR